MKKNYLWVLIIAVVALVLIIIFSSGSSDTPQALVSETPGSTTDPAKSTMVTPKAKSSNPPVTGKSYSQLVEEFKGRHIQFGMTCQASPTNVTYKNGTSVLFDNRSGDARTIGVNGKNYTFAGYGYKILTLSSNTLPKTMYLNCGASVNVGQILLQK